jgi:hypothetical protein
VREITSETLGNSWIHGILMPLFLFFPLASAYLRQLVQLRGIEWTLVNGKVWESIVRTALGMLIFFFGNETWHQEIQSVTSSDGGISPCFLFHCQLKNCRVWNSCCMFCLVFCNFVCYSDDIDDFLPRME